MSFTIDVEELERRENDPRFQELLAQQRVTRDADIKLTTYGIWQAEQTGIYLAHKPPFVRCYVSPYVRAMQTAEAIAGQLPYRLVIEPPDHRLREKEFGVLNGLDATKAKELYPEEFNRRKRDGKYWNSPSEEKIIQIAETVHMNSLISLEETTLERGYLL